MSIYLEFIENKPRLKRLKLPTRYYHFNTGENYIKLLSIGEGIFPKDKIQTSLTLMNSDCVLTTESATKVYPSTKDYGISRQYFKLQNRSNLEYINDELILFKKSKFIQLLSLSADAESTFFYVDIMSRGRSFEYFDFDDLIVRNRFKIDGELEYFENFSLAGEAMKGYFSRHHSEEHLYSKVYIKSADNERLRAHLKSFGFESFSVTRRKKMLIGVLSGTNMGILKKHIMEVWKIYRLLLDKNSFDLGKQ